MDKTFFKYSKYTNEELPEFGYKIHISATIENYKTILDLVLPFLDDLKVVYKYIYSEKDILFNFSKNEDAAESGKLITIYPQNTEDCKSLLSKIYDYLPKNLDGIYILSDRNYKDSNVIFYRFGTIKLNVNSTKNGLPTMKGPNKEIWQDYQKTFFDLPKWVKDIQEPQEFKDSYLYQNYKVTEVLKYSNGGNVYFGNDLKGKKVVIKESRPNILSFEKYKHRDERENEYRISQILDEYTPKTIEVADEWINKYFIYEYIEGDNFYKKLINLTIFKYKMNTPEKNVLKLKEYIDIIKSLIKLVKYYHNKNIILNDLHVDNFKQNEKGLFFIDLGNSYIYNEKPKYGIYNEICLREWNKIDGKIADIKKIGNLVLYTLAKLHVNKENEIENNINLLNELFLNYGIKTNLSKLIKRLFDNDIDIYKAEKIFEDIKIDIYDYVIELKTENREKDTKFSFYNYIYNDDFINILNTYDLENEDYKKYLIDKEKKLGLFGLSGILYYKIRNKDKDYNEKIIEYGVNSIIKKLIKINGKRIVPIKSYAGSPYINSGSAGLIKLLIYKDKKKYNNLIIELSENLITEFAQFPDYFYGMLGIADTLIDVFYIKPINKYLNSINSLLLNSILYLKYGKIDSNEFYYVYNRYLNLLEEII